VPQGWANFTISGIYSFAPTPPQLAAYPDVGDQTADRTFTVSIIADQREAFAEEVKHVRNDYPPGQGTWTERPSAVRSRKSQRLHHVFAANDQCDCIDDYTVIKWSQETVILLLVHAGSEKTFGEYERRVNQIVSSLRSGPVDKQAPVLHDFLRARIAGRGAERWLTVTSKDTYKKYGLYKLIDGGSRWRVYGYTVEEVRSTAEGTYFSVTVWGRSDSDGAGRTEGILIGSGRDLSGMTRPNLVLTVEELQAPGTS
jgi:hypothetical protein